METNFYAPMLLGQGCICGTGWEKVLAQDYREPQYHITLFRAIGRRLRRTYAYILTIQAFAYMGKIIIHPTPVTSFGEFVHRAAIGPVPGEAILLAGAVFNGAWIIFFVRSLFFGSGRSRCRPGGLLQCGEFVMRDVKGVLIDLDGVVPRVIRLAGEEGGEGSRGDDVGMTARARFI